MNTNTKEDHKTGERSTDAQIAQYVARAKTLLIELKSTPEICKILIAEFGKSKSSCKRYIRDATKELKADSKGDVDAIRGKHQHFLEDELRKALIASDGIIDVSDRVKAKKIMLEIWDRLVKLYPNQLQPEIENPDQVFNFNFTDATKADADAEANVSEEPSTEDTKE